MFSFRTFLVRGLLDAVGRQPDYWVILNAAGWMDKGVLTQEDLVKIQEAIDAYNEPQTPETGDIPTENVGGDKDEPLNNSDAEEQALPDTEEA